MPDGLPMRPGRRHFLAGAGALAALPGRAAPAPVRVRMVLDAGVIGIDLFTHQAPISCADFLRYVDTHCYDGGAFTRTVRADNDHGATRIDVVQGGVRAGVTALPPVAHESTRLTGLRHLDGTISIPRDKVGTGSGSEFFICVGAQPSLDFGGGRNKDGQGFAAFGRVTTGMDLVRAIWRADASGPSPDAYTRGQMLLHPVRIQSAARV
jgi:peptidyl-prolyl cis-trans isomerase A (cyclophilin A)